MNPTEIQPPPAEPTDAEILSDQRDANEHLVLATLRAQGEAEELRSVAAFRERLIAIVGHDLRTPLNSILIASRLLIAHGDLGDADGRLVDRIVDSGQRMARMISQVLDFTRGTLGGGISLALTPADLGAILRDVVEEHRLGSKADIQLEIAGDVTGHWDGDRLAVVASNLVGNALDHGSSATPVTVAVRGHGAMVVVEISNRGPTIPLALLPTLFEPFRSGVEGGRVGHMGLGLYISSEIVRSHGGTLEVRSADGSTTFTLSLPRTSRPS